MEHENHHRYDDDDDDDLQEIVDEQLRRLSKNPPRRLSNTVAEEGEEDDDEEEPEYISINDEDDLIENIRSIIDLTAEDDESHGRDATCIQLPSLRPSGTSSPSRSRRIIDKYHDDRLGCVSPGNFLELSQPLGHLNDASFILAKSIFECPNGDGVLIQGLPFTRNRYAKQLPKQRNEVCLILNIYEDDPRPEEQQGMIDVSINAIYLKRRFQITNTHYPEYRYLRQEGISDRAAEETGLLTWRWTRHNIFKNEVSRLMGKRPPYEFALIHIDETTARGNKAKFVQSDQFRRNRWRNRVIDLVDDNDGDGDDDDIVAIDPNNQDCRKYTFADMFCGAGGASQGAKEAGFDVLFSCDNMKAACETYRLNHPGTCLYERDIFDFINSVPTLPSVDIIHLSPPCQPYSPAHTRAGCNDETNIAALFACREIITKCRPRLFTLEQTFGILHPKSAHFFDAICRIFTSLDYSIRWKVADLLDYGCAARRRRLVLIGSAPGEPLPVCFPPPTHTPSQYETVARALRRIPRRTNDPLHRISPSPSPSYLGPPWDANKPLPRCITTDGGGAANYHPSGTRNFTLRELATLQGFPVGYKFSETYVKKQIGNAFPATAVKGILGFLREWLAGVDEGRRQMGVEAGTNSNEPSFSHPTSQAEDVAGDVEMMADGSSRASSVTIVGDEIVDLTMEDV